MINTARRSPQRVGNLPKVITSNNNEAPPRADEKPRTSINPIYCGKAWRSYRKLAEEEMDLSTEGIEIVVTRTNRNAPRTLLAFLRKTCTQKALLMKSNDAKCSNTFTSGMMMVEARRCGYFHHRTLPQDIAIRSSGKVIGINRASKHFR